MTNLSRSDIIRQGLNFLIILLTTALAPTLPPYVRYFLQPPISSAPTLTSTPATHLPPDVAPAISKTFVTWASTILDGRYADIVQRHSHVLDDIFKKFGKIPAPDTFYRQLLVHRVDETDAYLLKDLAQLLTAAAGPSTHCISS